MESIVAAVIVITLFILSAFSVIHASLSAQDDLMSTWQQVEAESAERARTNLTPITSTVKNGGSVVEVSLRNSGDTRLADFDRWDVLLQYYTNGNGYETDWYPYVEGSPGNNQWTVVQIFADTATASSEAIEPGILNPGEEMVVQLRVTPKIGTNTTNMLTMSTDNGIRASTVITR